MTKDIYRFHRRALLVAALLSVYLVLVFLFMIECGAAGGLALCYHDLVAGSGKYFERMLIFMLCCTFPSRGSATLRFALSLVYGFFRARVTLYIVRGVLLLP